MTHPNNLKDAEKARILHLRHDAGWSLNRIALDIGRDVRAVSRFVAGAPNDSGEAVATSCAWSKERIKTLTELWAKGLTGSEIGRAMGISKNAVVGKAHRLKLPGRPSPICPGIPGAKRRKSKAKHPTPIRQVPSLPVPTAEIVCLPHVSSPPQPTERTFAPRPMREREGRCDFGKSCRWPSGDGPIRFECEEPAFPGRPYCPEHMARAILVRTSKGTRPWTPEDDRPRRVRAEAAA